VALASNHSHPTRLQRSMPLLAPLLRLLLLDGPSPVRLGVFLHMVRYPSRIIVLSIQLITCFIYRPLQANSSPHIHLLLDGLTWAGHGLLLGPAKLGARRLLSSFCWLYAFVEPIKLDSLTMRRLNSGLGLLALLRKC
jgi:hypothetical protein